MALAATAPAAAQSGLGLGNPAGTQCTSHSQGNNSGNSHGESTANGFNGCPNNGNNGFPSDGASGTNGNAGGIGGNITDGNDVFNDAIDQANGDAEPDNVFDPTLEIEDGVAVPDYNDPDAMYDMPIDPADQSIVTPEPVTMVLLGTGLAGIGGAYRRRRTQ
jgi:hypothetical protein